MIWNWRVVAPWLKCAPPPVAVFTVSGPHSRQRRCRPLPKNQVFGNAVVKGTTRYHVVHGTLHAEQTSRSESGALGRSTGSTTLVPRRGSRVGRRGKSSGKWEVAFSVLRRRARSSRPQARTTTLSRDRAAEAGPAFASLPLRTPLAARSACLFPCSFCSTRHRPLSPGMEGKTDASMWLSWPRPAHSGPR
jgi:hypothetical protein